MRIYKVDFNKKLQMAITFENNDVKPEEVAYKFWFELIKPYQERNLSPWARLIDARFNKFQLLMGEKKDFAIAATFWVKPESETWSIFHNWGKRQKDGTIQNIHWTMGIKNTGKKEYRHTRLRKPQMR
ncbi:hypothetical protein J7E81_08845 [Bacillus sp. ISL-18]|uniref:hypothetical protein n=1 Tax=Bacillus sp. ISL-18 TaxID=2819118 RepID=UPI001BE8ABBB|nr:hypothetical protein [Bacillus sp. ISL-18]MBT2655344.1 hypothetical protein [Bacillus sp. ISL-18]